MACRHCGYQCSPMRMGDSFPIFCPGCGCPKALPLNHPLVLSGKRAAGDTLSVPWLREFSTVTVSVNGKVLRMAGESS